MLDKSIDERYKSGAWARRKPGGERRRRSGGSFGKLALAAILLATAAFALWYALGGEEFRSRVDRFGNNVKMSARPAGRIEVKPSE